MAYKNRMLFLLKYLQQNSDEDHPLKTADLMGALHDQGYDIKLSTLKSDIDTLIDAGYEIDVQEPVGYPKTYTYIDRAWSAPELQILIDAVSSSQFLTPNKSRDIIQHLVEMAPPSKRHSLQPSILVSDHIKARNNQIFLIVQTIKEGIDRNKKIVFQYCDYNLQKERVHRHKGAEYIVSPYATIWKDDRYYLVGWYDGRSDINTFRVDRMDQVTISEEDRVPPPETFNVQDYSQKIFYMFNGEEKQVTLRCNNSLIGQVIDKFGEGIELKNKTRDTFDVTVPVCLSGTFYGWLFQYAGEMTVVEPAMAREWYINSLEKAMDDVLGVE